MGAVVVAARQSFAGAELGLGRRADQGLVAVGVAAGEQAGAAALRVSGTAAFVLLPFAAGWTPYAGLGLSVVGVRGASGAGYLTGVLGLETTPRGRRSWYVEAGLGGGVRAAAGIRWRHAPPG